MRNLYLIVTLSLLVGCIPTKEASLDTSRLSFMAKIDETPSHLSKGNYKVDGTLQIKNKSNSPVMYSNKDLFLVINNKSSSRARTDSPASHVIDFSTVELSPGTLMELDVYWVVQPDQSLNGKDIALEWRH